jgi:hypothetical protein
MVADKETGRRVEPVLVDKATGRQLTDLEFESVPGPAADDEVLARFERRRQKREPS